MKVIKNILLTILVLGVIGMLLIFSMIAGVVAIF